MVQFCGSKFIRDDINPNTILKETLIPNSVSLRPVVLPFAVDWGEEVLAQPEVRIVFDINGVETEFYNAELQLIEPSENGELLFELVTPEVNIKFKQKLLNNDRYDDFKIERIALANERYFVRIVKKQYVLEDFLCQNPITWWFVDGSSLTGNDYVELKHVIPSYPKENIIQQDWSGFDLSKESQGIERKKTDSIQYKVIADLKEADYNIR